MSDREYYNRMLKDLQALKKEVLSFAAQKRKECGYIPITIPNKMSHVGRPLSAEEFTERLHFVIATTIWLQSILDKLNGLTSSCAIDMLELNPYPHPSKFNEKRGRRPLGKKTQENLLQKGFNEDNKKTGQGMRSWIKSSKEVSEQTVNLAKDLLDKGEPLCFIHVDEDGKVTSTTDSKKQRAFIEGSEVMKNHHSESLLRALAKGKQKSGKK